MKTAKKKSSVQKMHQKHHDAETLRVWKNSTTLAKLTWLESALRMAKLKKF